mmetsp:Transcript_82994/g.173758  ORF Transcript_82994/g.173758 Transcript_82994/m.173758 type:complete len:309 (-) Transcript_82994:43-969(-)
MDFGTGGCVEPFETSQLNVALTFGLLEASSTPLFVGGLRLDHNLELNIFVCEVDQEHRADVFPVRALKLSLIDSPSDSMQERSRGAAVALQHRTDRDLAHLSEVDRGRNFLSTSEGRARWGIAWRNDSSEVWRRGLGCWHHAWAGLTRNHHRGRKRAHHVKDTTLSRHAARSCRWHTRCPVLIVLHSVDLIVVASLIPAQLRRPRGWRVRVGIEVVVEASQGGRLLWNGRLGRGVWSRYILLIVGKGGRMVYHSSVRLRPRKFPWECGRGLIKLEESVLHDQARTWRYGTHGAVCSVHLFKAKKILGD